MKRYTKLLSFLLLGLCLVLNSCSEETESNGNPNYFDSTTTLNIKKHLEKSKRGSDNFQSKGSFDFTNTVGDSVKVRVVGYSSHDIKNHDSVEKLNAFILENNVSLNHEFYVNDVKWWQIKYVNGILLENQTVVEGGGSVACGRDSDGSTTDGKECSSLGINCCSWNVIDEWHAVRRIWESFTGGAQGVIGDCILRNCFGW
jgi:hypothetical protein